VAQSRTIRNRRGGDATTQMQKPMAVASDQVITRAQRAHWRLSWNERLARNARRATAAPLTVTIHGLPITFANLYGFALLEAA
jgi:hypothetical protein